MGIETRRGRTKDNAIYSYAVEWSKATDELAELPSWYATRKSKSQKKQIIVSAANYEIENEKMVPTLKSVDPLRLSQVYTEVENTEVESQKTKAPQMIIYHQDWPPLPPPDGFP
jgi:hypothetical protein